jgi:hypothetical protein
MDHFETRAIAVLMIFSENRKERIKIDSDKRGIMPESCS